MEKIKTEVDYTQKIKKRNYISNNFEIIAFVYYFVGAIYLLLGKHNIEFFIVNDYSLVFYLYTFWFSGYVYIVFSCFLYKHITPWVNLIDGLLCFVLSSFRPLFLAGQVYEYNKYIYYLFATMFVFMPLICTFIDIEKINKRHILKVITRIFMVTFLVLIILSFNSCALSVNH